MKSSALPLCFLWLIHVSSQVGFPFFRVCRAYHWRCSYTRCIDKKQRCDGHIHCDDGSDEQNCAKFYDGHLGISPPHFVSNGSQAVTLTCTYTGGNPRPDHYEWSITACSERSPGNTCTFTPDPTAEDFKTVRCRALRSLGNRNVAAGSLSVHLNISYPPSDKPVIQSQNSDRGYLQPGDVVTCTVTGGSPPVESVHLSCIDPSLPDKDDQRGATAVTSSVTITHAVQVDVNVEMTCSCKASWNARPQYYQLTSTAVYIVGRAPQKLFAETLTMTGDGIVFTLEAYPVPDLFAFTHLGDSRSGPRKAVNPTLFSPECRKNTKKEYTVSCVVVPSGLPENRLGLYLMTVSNALGNVDVTLQARQEDRAVVERLTVNGMEETVTLNRDDQVTLVCGASGRPVPSVNITHGHTDFTERDVRYDRTGSTSSQAVLTLSAAHCDDMGTYTCTATNGIAGSDTKTIRLNTNCQSSTAVWVIVLVSVVSVVVIFATCIAVFFLTRRYKVRGSVDSIEARASSGTSSFIGDRSSSEYQEVHERGAIQLAYLTALPSHVGKERPVQQVAVDQEPLPLMSEPLQDRPLPELPDTTVVRSVVEQSLPTQNRPLPETSDTVVVVWLPKQEKTLLAVHDAVQ